MTLTKITRVVYGLFGALYLLIGVGAMLAPAGWLPHGLVDDSLASELQSEFAGHQVQELGSVIVALGMVFLWYATRKQQSAVFHWLITLYFALDTLIHWIGPQGPYGSLQRGLINSIPFAVMLTLGVLQLRSARAMKNRQVPR